ncbi:MAG: CBS domain-containing protein [Caldilineae bacterium]|nr:MAG: CBS domain-containing protein [Caldilineae bacterium]
MPAKAVAEVMHPGVVTCRPTTSILEIVRLMNQHDISAVVVVDDHDRLAGIVTRNEMVAFYGYEEMWPHLQADQIMITQVATALPDEPAFRAAQEMRRRRMQHVVVVEANDATRRPRPVGVVSATDLVRDMEPARPQLTEE